MIQQYPKQPKDGFRSKGTKTVQFTTENNGWDYTQLLTAEVRERLFAKRNKEAQKQVK